MKAITLTAFGCADVLKLVEHKQPIIGQNEVLIRVQAAGINRADIAQRKGNYPAPNDAPADILGLEIAGIIETVAPDVTQWQIGDKVFALVSGGGYSEYITVNQSVCLPIPENLSFVEAASFPETVYTIWSNVFERGKLARGENFLVHGGSSGIGITAIQLARIFGAHVFTTVGSDSKKKFCEDLGATAINYKEEDFYSAFNQNKMDVILDMIGADYFYRNIRLLNPEGRLIFINTMSGKDVNVDLLYLMQNRISVTGSTLRSRELAYKISLTQNIKEHILPLIASGQLKPVIYATFPLEQAAKAHKLMESSKHIGKIILTV